MRCLLMVLCTVSVIEAMACSNPNNRLPGNADSMTNGDSGSPADSIQPADMDKLPTDSTFTTDTVKDKKGQDSDFDKVKAKGDKVRKDVAEKAKAIGQDIKEGSEPLRNGIKKGANSVKKAADKIVQKVKKTVSDEEEDKGNPGDR